MRKIILGWILSQIKVEDVVWLIKKVMKKMDATELEFKDITPKSIFKGKVYYTIKRKES